MEQCETCGCKEKASMVLIQTVGKKQRLKMCETHRPVWSKDTAKVAANKFYLVEELN